MRHCRCLLPSLLALLAGCAGDKSFPPVDGDVNRIVVSSNSEPWTTITDSARIRGIVRFINARTENWGGSTDRFGVPIGRIRVQLYDSTIVYNKGFKGSFSVGPRFFETQRNGTFASRRASRAEIAEFTALIGVRVEWVETGIPPGTPTPR